MGDYKHSFVTMGNHAAQCCLYLGLLVAIKHVSPAAIPVTEKWIPQQLYRKITERCMAQRRGSAKHFRLFHAAPPQIACNPE